MRSLRLRIQATMAFACSGVPSNWVARTEPRCGAYQWTPSGCPVWSVLGCAASSSLGAAAEGGGVLRCLAVLVEVAVAFGHDLVDAVADLVEHPGNLVDVVEQGEQRCGIGGDGLVGEPLAALVVCRLGHRLPPSARGWKGSGGKIPGGGQTPGTVGPSATIWLKRSPASGITPASGRCGSTQHHRSAIA